MILTAKTLYPLLERTVCSYTSFMTKEKNSMMTKRYDKAVWCIIPLASLLALACERKAAAPTAPATEEGAAAAPVFSRGDADTTLSPSQAAEPAEPVQPSQAADPVQPALPTLPDPVSEHAPTVAQSIVAEVFSTHSNISFPGIGIGVAPTPYTLTASLAAPTLSPNANQVDCDISAVASATASSNLTGLTYVGSFLNPASELLTSAASSSALTATFPFETASGSYLLNWGVTATLPDSTSVTANASRTFSLLREAPTTLVARTPAATIAGNTQSGRQIPFLVGPGQCAQSLPAQSYASVAAGGSHSCAVSRSGGVVCWGLNGGGQLGNNSRISSTAPVAVSLASGDRAVAVSAGWHHSCAVLSTGVVKCWGTQGKGGSASLIPAPVAFWDAADSAVAIAAGTNHSCALLSDGQIKCWGLNLNGQLGSASLIPTASATPLQVALGGSTAVSIAVGGNNSCALLSDGQIKCWGSNSAGRLGTGDTTSTTSATPLQVALGGSTAVSVAVGADYSCALLSDGGSKCWGAMRGVGDTITTAFATPVAVALGGSTAVSIAVGTSPSSASHSCALLSDGGVKCWGSNSNGQLGSTGQLSSFSAVSAGPLDVLSVLPLDGTVNPAPYLSGQSLSVWLMSILSP